MSGLDPFGNGQKFLTSFLHVALALLQYNNVTLGLLLPNQQGSWVRLQSLTQDAILVYRVLTSKACTKALCRSLVATHTSTNFWVRLQANGIPVQALPIPLLYVNSFHFWSFMLAHPAGEGDNQKGNEGSSLVTQTVSGKGSSCKFSGEGSSQVLQAVSDKGSSCNFSGEGSSRSLAISGVQHPATSGGPQQSTISSGSSSVQQTAAAGGSSSVQQVTILLALPRLI